MPTSLTLNVPPDGPQHRFLVDRLGPRISMAETSQSDRHEKWREAEERVLAYLPESETDLRRRRRREAGQPSYTTIQIPYSYALLLTAHTYWTTVFFSRQPVHQYTGRHGETEQQIMALEALIDYQILCGRILAPYYIWLYDAAKYGVGILGTYWERKESQYSTIAPGEDGGKLQSTFRLLEYEGNCGYNVCPFDFLPDPRVTVGDFQKGEFCIIRRRVPWNEILRRKAQGYYVNTERILSKTGTRDPAKQSWSALVRPSEAHFMTEDDAKHPSLVEVYECYVELTQREWKLGSSDFPEKWVFTITADKSLILGAQPLGMMHCRFPFDVMEQEIEAYGAWNRGIPEVAEPIQNTMDWLVNSHFYNVRSVLNNLFLADPTKIVMKDLENSEPGGVIRIKPEALGQDLSTFFMQIPIQDVTGKHLDDMQGLQNLGERLFGVNEQMMGALAQGGRKTATEVRTATGFGVNRQKTITEYQSAACFAEHSQKLVMNSQQFYSAERRLRIVGDLSREAGARFLNVSPEEIAGFYDFVPVDGTLPIDRFAQVNLWTQMMQQVSQIPQVVARYDLGRIFGWVAVLAGLKNLRQFEIQVAPDEQLQQQAQAGNVIPLPGARTQSDTRATGVREPGQEQMGANAPGGGY